MPFDKNFTPVLRFAVMSDLHFRDEPCAEEQRMVYTWLHQYGMPLELVIEACNRTMTAIHQPICDTPRIDNRGLRRNEKQADEKACPFCADYKIDLILGRHDGLKNHASPLCETLLTPFIAVIGGLQHSILVIQIAEIV